MVFSKQTRRRVGLIIIIALVIWVAYSVISGGNLGIL